MSATGGAAESCGRGTEPDKEWCLCLSIHACGFGCRAGEPAVICGCHREIIRLVPPPPIHSHHLPSFPPKYRRCRVSSLKHCPLCPLFPPGPLQVRRDGETGRGMSARRLHNVAPIKLAPVSCFFLFLCFFTSEFHQLNFFSALLGKTTV